MMKKKRLCLVLIAILSLMACSSDDDNGLPREGLFISINNDSRKISGLFKKGKGELEVSAYGFDSTYDEPKGVQFVMDIYDPNKEYVGDIGGLYGCTEVEVFVDVFQTEFPDKNIKTVMRVV